VPLYAISVQNEPDWPATYEGCLWTGATHRDFLAAHGDKIKTALLVSGESLNTDHSFYKPALEDEAACAALDIIGGHLYGKKPDSFSLAAEKGKRLWMTEHLLNDSWEKGTGTHWDETMDMVIEMNQCLRLGWNAYIWWYGRRYYSLIGDGEQGTTKGRILPRGHAFGQFSRHIHPGYTRVGVDISGGTTKAGSPAASGASGLASRAETSLAEALEVSAYTGDGHTVLVLINTSSSAIDELVADFSSAIGSGSLAAATATCTASDMSSESLHLTTTGTTITLSLPARSITTITL